MSDTSEGFAGVNLINQQRKATNREHALAQRDEARQLAIDNGFVLCWYSEVHYRLLHKASAAIFDLYPGNQRIYRVRGKWHINGLPSDWTLLDVVKAAVAAVK